MKRSLFAELRRRNVFKACIAYVALGREVTATVQPWFPPWFSPLRAEPRYLALMEKIYGNPQTRGAEARL